MSITTAYTAVGAALTDVAREYDTTPYNVRVAVALLERAGSATTFELQRDLLDAHGSAVRRAALDLYRLGWAEGLGSDGGRRRPGICSRVTLTALGREAAGLAVEDARVAA